MLPSELLRTRTNRGKITPLFCTSDFGNGTDYELANKLVTFFTNAQKSKQAKGDLLEKIKLLESEYDYKLVRGFFTLLERRSIFTQLNSVSTNATPMLIRQKLFEQSSKQGLALSDSRRQEIIQYVATQLHISSDDVQSIMWRDKDENLVLSQFDAINPKDLIFWYNLSLFQTLLFKCTKLEFYVKGGLYWKQVLRNVKRYGLMYNLEYDSEDNDSIRCVLDGPLSLFKMTDRYGVSMAKLLPSILSTPFWKIGGSITKKTDDGQRFYAFELSSESTAKYLRSIIENPSQNSQNAEFDDSVYDSSTEAIFAKKFCQHFDQNDKDGWKISREPDPLIADGKAMIPDFLFERYGRKMYFEIVGFWTKEYLERKTAKLEILFEGNQNDARNKSVDLLIAINSELSCSQIESISQDKVFTFKKEVQLKHVLEHLKKIDAEITEEKTKDVKIDLDLTNSGLVSLDQIAQKHGIPVASALKVITATYPDIFVTINSYLLSKDKMNLIRNALDHISKFVDACSIMKSDGIPDSCHADLLSELGYDVIWPDLDPNNASIYKK
ncbi:DUF790 family protein [Nitrosopumilus sp.]|uniref:DUF790 family protein n=1 Tax=Nitrosopumilus sp. TaxID=2024843 RepID=UPI0026058D2C|nr:DUF790 family protein [Nitrosopumilus sp.]